MCERLLNLQEIYVSGQSICIEVYGNSVGTITPLISCGIGPNYVEISTKSVKDVFDVGHFDFVTSALYMTFQGTLALKLALILALIRISVR